MKILSTLPIILDTDIGDDVDDALALALILNSPELDLRGVTTVYRDASRRALLAQHFLEVWERHDVPVAAGCSKPLLSDYITQLGNQILVLEEAGKSMIPTAPTEHAVDFLLRTISSDQASTENPITIVPIGPLTNVALALAKDPSLASRCRIVLMGGMWNQQAENFKVEYNIYCDPEAAQIVFNSGAPIWMVGLDVTLKCNLREEHIEQLAKETSPRVQVAARVIELFKQERKRLPTLHDPLAVLTLFSECVRFEEKRIDIVLSGKERGEMRVLEGAPNAHVAVDVDAERAIDLFMQRLLV